MKSLIVVVLFYLLSLQAKAQNNYIVKIDDGRRVLLKADFTWEYIDLKKPEMIENNVTDIKETKTIIAPITNCGLEPNFSEFKLNTKTQALLKRNRSSINHLKKKVANKENCDIDNILLISANETKAKGTYNFCTCNGKVAYKRNGSSFFKKGKLF